MTRSEATGATLRNLLRSVTDARPVDLIHAHGTGTIANDPIELRAFEQACVHGDATSPRVYSHKAALGHSLGAAGLVSIVLNCLMHAKETIPANVRTHRPLVTAGIRIAREPETACIRRSLAVAAGFGGPVAAVSLVSP
jgi:3-oxoacyl-[acyl-carrier-protein] synthase II